MQACSVIHLLIRHLLQEPNLFSEFLIFNKYLYLYLLNFQIQRDMVDGYRPSMLCIEDPLTPGNDIGRSSYGALKVKQSFEFAYTTLLQAVSPMCPKFMSEHSILGRIVLITDEVVEYRCWIRDTYADKVPVRILNIFRIPLVNYRVCLSSACASREQATSWIERLQPAAAAKKSFAGLGRVVVRICLLHKWRQLSNRVCCVRRLRKIFCHIFVLPLLITVDFRTRKRTMSRQATAWNRITSRMSIVRAQEQSRWPPSGEHMVKFLDAFFNNVLPKFWINYGLIVPDRECNNYVVIS